MTKYVTLKPRDEIEDDWCIWKDTIEKFQGRKLKVIGRDSDCRKIEGDEFDFSRGKDMFDPEKEINTLEVWESTEHGTFVGYKKDIPYSLSPEGKLIRHNSGSLGTT